MHLREHVCIHKTKTKKKKGGGGKVAVGQVDTQRPREGGSKRERTNVKSKRAKEEK